MHMKNECSFCDAYDDEREGCTMPSCDKSYACSLETKIELELDSGILGDIDEWRELDISHYKDYILYLADTGIKSTSINTKMRAVKAFYNYLIDAEQIGDCSRKLRLVKQSRQEIIPLSDDEIYILLNSFDLADTLELRNKCIVMVMLDSGLRRSEVTRLRFSDIDLRNKRILVNGKGAKERIVPLGDTTSEMFGLYLERQSSRLDKKSSPLFADRCGNLLEANAIDKIFEKLKQITGIDRLHPHLLRHTFATLYIVDGGDLETLRILLGHSSIAITQIYLHLATNYRLLQDRHKSHIDKLHK